MRSTECHSSIYISFQEVNGKCRCLSSDLCLPERARDRTRSCQEGVVSSSVQPLQENLPQPPSFRHLIPNTDPHWPLGCHGWWQECRDPLQTVVIAVTGSWSKRWKCCFVLMHSVCCNVVILMLCCEVNKVKNNCFCLLQITIVPMSPASFY